jgi:hypothetical protein
MRTKTQRAISTLITSIGVLSTVFTSPQLAHAQDNRQPICFVLLDVSASNNEGTGSESTKSSDTVTEPQKLDLAKARDILKIARGCAGRKARFEMWAIDKNPQALRDPIIALSFRKEKGDPGSHVDLKVKSIDCALIIALDIPVKSGKTKPTKCSRSISTTFDPSGTDIFGALDVARRRLNQWPNDQRKSLYALTDGINTSFGIDFYNIDLGNQTIRRQVLVNLKKQKFLDPLPKVDGCFVGINAQTGENKLDEQAGKGLIDLWTTIAKTLSPSISVNVPCW